MVKKQSQSETIMHLPIKTLNNLYHVGTLNPKDKKKVVMKVTDYPSPRTHMNGDALHH